MFSRSGEKIRGFRADDVYVHLFPRHLQERFVRESVFGVGDWRHELVGGFK
jgi:hypothetical protein